MNLNHGEDSNDALVGEVNIDNVENQVWLVKVPKFLADHWKTSGITDLGKIHIKGGNNISITGVSSSEEFQLTTSPIPDNQPIKIFSEDKDGGLALEGNISLKCDLRMNFNSETYRNLCKKRTTLYNTKTSVAKTIDETQPYSGADKFKISRIRIGIQSGLSTQKAQPVDKKERKSEDEVIDHLFRIFDTNDYHDLKSLAKETDQPTNFLKQVLLKICDLNKSGPNKNMYQLKKEYGSKK